MPSRRNLPRVFDLDVAEKLNPMASVGAVGELDARADPVPLAEDSCPGDRLTFLSTTTPRSVLPRSSSMVGSTWPSAVISGISIPRPSLIALGYIEVAERLLAARSDPSKWPEASVFPTSGIGPTVLPLLNRMPTPSAGLPRSLLWTEPRTRTRRLQGYGDLDLPSRRRSCSREDLPVHRGVGHDCLDHHVCRDEAGDLESPLGVGHHVRERGDEASFLGLPGRP